MKKGKGSRKLRKKGGSHFYSLCSKSFLLYLLIPLFSPFFISILLYSIPLYTPHFETKEDNIKYDKNGTKMSKNE